MGWQQFWVLKTELTSTSTAKKDCCLCVQFEEEWSSSSKHWWSWTPCWWCLLALSTEHLFPPRAFSSQCESLAKLFTCSCPPSDTHIETHICHTFPRIIFTSGILLARSITITLLLPYHWGEHQQGAESIYETTSQTETIVSLSERSLALCVYLMPAQKSAFLWTIIIFDSPVRYGQTAERCDQSMRKREKEQTWWFERGKNKEHLHSNGNALHRYWALVAFSTVKHDTRMVAKWTLII